MIKEMKSIFLAFLLGCMLALSCDSINEQSITLSADEQFSYDLNVCGDEEGAKIIEQAKHYSQSEIIRDSTTNWCAYYFYTSETGYRGIDQVTIETCTGGKGVRCDKIQKIEFKFHID